MLIAIHTDVRLKIGAIASLIDLPYHTTRYAIELLGPKRS